MEEMKGNLDARVAKMLESKSAPAAGYFDLLAEASGHLDGLSFERGFGGRLIPVVKDGIAVEGYNQRLETLYGQMRGVLKRKPELKVHAGQIFFEATPDELEVVLGLEGIGRIHLNEDAGAKSVAGRVRAIV